LFEMVLPTEKFEFSGFAKVALHALTTLKIHSKCLFIPYKLRFFAYFSAQSDFCIRVQFLAHRGWIIPILYIYY